MGMTAILITWGALTSDTLYSWFNSSINIPSVIPKSAIVSKKSNAQAFPHTTDVTVHLAQQIFFSETIEDYWIILNTFVELNGYFIRLLN